MPFVGTRPGGDTYDPTSGIAVLGVEVVRDHTKFLRGIGVGKWTRSLKVVIHMRDAIQLVENPSNTAAVHDGRRLIRGAAPHTRESCPAGLRSVHSTRR